MKKALFCGLMVVVILWHPVWIAIQPALYVWEGTVEIPTLSWGTEERVEEVLKKIPAYCQDEPGGDLLKDFSFIIKDFSLAQGGDAQYDIVSLWDTKVLKFYEGETGGRFTLEVLSDGTWVLTSARAGYNDFPSQRLKGEYLGRVLEENSFRLRRLEMKFSGYDPESRTSNVEVRCVVKKNSPSLSPRYWIKVAGNLVLIIMACMAIFIILLSLI